MGGCLGSGSKPTLVTTVDEPLKGPLKGLVVESRRVKKPSLSDFWTTSACDMDHSAAQSQNSISSIGTSNQNFDLHSGVNSTSSEFVNHGLLLWNQTRQSWVAKKRPESRGQRGREPKLSWNATYESLLGTNKPFHQPVPLSEMVDFLVDVWEQEGMYD